MAALAPIASPNRRVFGILDESRMKRLSHVKNVQNAIPSSGSSLKRRLAASDFSDSENVDPTAHKSPSKRKRLDEDDLAKPIKPSQFILNTVTKKAQTPPARLHTPRSAMGKRSLNAASTPLSAPAAAGRSPVKSKQRAVGLSRRRASGSPYTRIDPPSFNKSRKSAAPFSLATALSGTIQSYDAKPAGPALAASIEESVPKSWLFEIHEDTPQEEMTILMEHSACTLDISDDEDRVKAKNERGKENVPPGTVLTLESIAVTTTMTSMVPASRKDMMTDEPRTPLGDLNAADYYAAGCDETSVIVVREDVEEEQTCNVDEAAVSEAAVTSAVPIFKEDIHSIVMANLPSAEDVAEDMSVSEPAEIEIWESASAADEAEKEEFVPEEAVLASV